MRIGLARTTYPAVFALCLVVQIRRNSPFHGPDDEHSLGSMGQTSLLALLGVTGAILNS